MPLLALILATSAFAAGPPKVPDGFEIRLVASVPAVNYPCQVATGPGGLLFVAEDPMDQVGPYEAFHGRILLFRDGQDPLVFAEGLRAVQGMAWSEGQLYVSHMPFLTVLKDADADGKSDSRKDLFKDLGPTKNQGLNDHIVSGIQFGMDGWLYISTGDKGVPGATRPEDGVKVQLLGGGTLRCRPDGTGLEVYSRGTRNHLEANLDAADHVFTYDNTDDGDGWWTRVTYHVDGGYYGYPHDYATRPDRHLPRIAEYGGGSPCGAAFYRDDVWPEPYRNAGFWAEWGKRKVQAIRFAPAGAGFKVVEMIDFAVPADGDTFNPIDLAFSDDGLTLYVADWNMGGWGSKTEKVGRVFAITPRDKPAGKPRGSDSDPIADQVHALDHPAYSERLRAQRSLIRQGRAALDTVARALADPKTPPLAKRHLLWALDAIAGGTPEATMPTLETLKSPTPDLRAQAARALGLRQVPIAVEPLIGLLKDVEPSVRLQALIALGRIRDPQAVPAVLPLLAENDPYLALSAREALRRIADWDAAAPGLNSNDPAVRLGLLATLEQVYDPTAARLLAAYAEDSKRAADERAKALTYLAQGHRYVPPWDGKWWGTRPRTSSTIGKLKTETWQGTDLVLNAVRSRLDDPAVELRRAAIAGVVETKDKAGLPILRARFKAEPDPSTRREIALALGGLGDRDSIGVLVAALADSATPEPVRDGALSALETLGASGGTSALIELLKRPDFPAEYQPRVVATLGKAKANAAIPVLKDKLASPDAPIRASAAEALGKIGAQEVAPTLRSLIADPNADAARAAIAALAALKDRDAVPTLIVAVQRDATWFEAANALTSVPDARAIQVYLRGISQPNPDLRRASAAAISAIRDESVPILERLADRKELPTSALPELRRIFAGAAPISKWRLLGPFPRDAQSPLKPDRLIDTDAAVPGPDGKALAWQTTFAIDGRGQVDLNRLFGGDQRAVYGLADVSSPKARKAEMVVGSDDTLTIWLNGKQVYDHQDDRGFDYEQGRFEVELNEGPNHVLIRCTNSGGGWGFSVAVTAPAEHAFLQGPSPGAFDPDRFAAFAQTASGDAAKGKALFADPKGLACAKCHAVAGQGGDVGPDLSGIGVRYNKAELIRSILYPSAAIFSGYEPVVIATTDGQVVTGILKGETPESVEIQDAEAKRVKVPKTEIEERKLSDVSLMPNGLAEGLRKEDFADLIAYLETLKEAPKPTGP